ncbi:hypothetical protein PT974_02150 [Cladobotryum mycophilum]|uniref:Aminoglycoside phosphotransferase domain-containing protein n=1 Tax=Cladobotryum mycophilum TaxID=491253 RepID=A0ABR0SXD5_9HYPO
MKPVIHSLRDSIDDFFKSHSDITQEECDQFAIDLIGGPVAPLSVQGFRTPFSDLDAKLLDAARQIHGKLVATCSFRGRIGQGSLLIYSMEKLPGIPYISAAPLYRKGPEAELLQLKRSTTVEDFALFFADSWKGRQSLPADAMDKLHADYHLRFERLAQSLPSRFQRNLKDVRSSLPRLFSPEYPLAVNHGDLSQTNILIDPDGGHITGIIDRTEARISPFGIPLWEVDSVLGYMNSGGWHYHDGYLELRALFWQTFEGAVGSVSYETRCLIDVARMAGLFLRYGFASDGDGQQVVREDDPSFMYLDAFCALENPAARLKSDKIQERDRLKLGIPSDDHGGPLFDSPVSVPASIAWGWGYPLQPFAMESTKKNIKPGDLCR